MGLFPVFCSPNVIMPRQEALTPRPQYASILLLGGVYANDQGRLRVQRIRPPIRPIWKPSFTATASGSGATWNARVCAETPEASEYPAVKQRLEQARQATNPNHPRQQPNVLLSFVGNPRESMPQGLPFRLTDPLAAIVSRGIGFFHASFQITLLLSRPDDIDHRTISSRSVVARS